MWWTLIALGMRVLFSILSDCRFFSWSSKQHSPLLLSHSDSISERETGGKKTLISQDWAQRSRTRFVSVEQISWNVFHPVFRAENCGTTHQPDFITQLLRERSVSDAQNLTAVSSRLVSSMRAGGLLSVFHHHNHFSYRKKERRVLRIPRRGR